MRRIIQRWHTAVGILMILLLATACFSNVGDQGNPPSISLQITDTPIPTPTEEPSLTPEPLFEETEDFEAQDGDAIDLPIAQDPTETATETATATEGITEVAQLGEGLGGQLATDTPDIFALTATSLVSTATATYLLPTWIAETQTAQAIMVNPPVTATIDPTLFPLVTATFGSQPPVLSGADCVHQVRTGDNLFRMSMNYGIPVIDIANRNGVTNPDLISVGQMLVINGCGTTGVFPPATDFPTETFGTGGPLTTDNLGGGGGGCTAQYTVNQYDTLFQISMQYGVPVQSIANANGISNINFIDMGSVLCIPAS
jgi:LysM repeat protein